MARATMLAMKMGRNKGKDWREMLEEELAKKKGGGLNWRWRTRETRRR